MFYQIEQDKNIEDAYHNDAVVTENLKCCDFDFVDNSDIFDGYQDAA